MSARDRVVILLRRVSTLCRIQRSTRHSRIVAIYAWRPIWHPFAENWSIISFPRFREFEETRSHNGGGGGMPRCATAENQSDNDNDICNVAVRLPSGWPTGRWSIGCSLKPNHPVFVPRFLPFHAAAIGKKSLSFREMQTTRKRK